jgi:hypothetical protein
MVRPIDGQQVILQTNAIEKLQQIHQQQSSTQQNYIEFQLKQEKILARETVQDSSKTEKSEIKDRDKDNNKNKLPQPKIKRADRADDETEIENDLESEGKGKYINIKV